MERKVELASIEGMGQQVNAQLEAEKRRINDEINHYPPPIPACDAHFNYLLEQRAAVAHYSDRRYSCACYEPVPPGIRQTLPGHPLHL